MNSVIVSDFGTMLGKTSLRLQVVRGQELLTFVVYDIVDDGVRGRVANACKDYGLERIQYSAFCGALDSTRRNIWSFGWRTPWAGTWERSWCFRCARRTRGRGAIS
jgi:hypothetical protein